MRVVVCVVVVALAGLWLAQHVLRTTTASAPAIQHLFSRLARQKPAIGRNRAGGSGLQPAGTGAPCGSLLEREAGAVVANTRVRFTVDEAVQVLAANSNNRAIQCAAGWNGWKYVCTFFNGADPRRAGFEMTGPVGSPLLVDLPARGPIPTARRR